MSDHAEEINLDISGVVEKDGKKIAHIRFSRGEDYAEGYIPDCVLTKVSGFTEEEALQLSDYLRANLTEFKKRAAAINPLTALMGKAENKK
jgi:hypothetical protein